MNLDIIKQEKKFLITLFLLSFLVRALFFGFFLSKEKRYFFCDSDVYHDVGVQIADGNGILKADGTHNFMRVPGYSMFLALMYKLFDKDDIKALWVQVLLASFIPLLIFCLSLIIFPSKLLLAKIVGIFSSFHLGFVLFSGVMMTESLFCIFFLLFMVLFLSNFNYFFCKDYIKKKSYKSIFFAGIFLGLASLIRPVGQYLILLLLLMFLFSKNNWSGKFKNMTLLFLGWFLIVSGWLIRNYLLTGFIFFHSWPGFHFLHYTAAPIVMHVDKTSFRESSIKVCVNEWGGLIKEEENKKERKLSEIEKCVIGEKLAFSYLKEYPFLAIKNAFYNMFKTCVGLYSSDLLMIVSGYPECCYDKDRTVWNMIERFLMPSVEDNWLRIVIWLEIFFFFIILLGFGFSLFQCFFDYSLLCKLLKFLPIIALMIFLSLATGFARLRLPIEPFLIVLSFNFWLTLFKKKALHHV